MTGSPQGFDAVKKMGPVHPGLAPCPCMRDVGPALREPTGYEVLRALPQIACEADPDLFAATSNHRLDDQRLI